MLKAFKTDASYLENIKNYNKKDTLTAFGVWLIVMIVYFAMGQLYALKGIYLGTPVNFVLAGLCTGIILLKKEKLSGIGFSRKNAGKSFLLGLVLGVIFVLGNNVILAVITHGKFDSLLNILVKLAYYLFVISFTEEIIFRGFIQPRVYGIFKNSVAAIFAGAIMFMLIHIPFQMGYAHMSLFSYVAGNWITLLFTFFWHIVFNYLYRKYNSIYAPAIFHGLMDWGNYLFI